MDTKEKNEIKLKLNKLTTNYNHYRKLLDYNTSRSDRLFMIMNRCGFTKKSVKSQVRVKSRYHNSLQSKIDLENDIPLIRNEIELLKQKLSQQ
jgi:hypothetical protein